MKHLGFSKIFSYYYSTSDEIEGDELDSRFENFGKELDELFQKYGMKFADSYTTFYGLEKYSICNCEKCNQLMVNRDKNPAGFGKLEISSDIECAIYDGGELDGKVLCEECLPDTHRWGVN